MQLGAGELSESVCAPASQAMALKGAWHSAARRRLPPIEQAKLWGLRWALQKQKEDDTQWEWMASKVVTKGGSPPNREAVRQLPSAVPQ